MERANFLKNGKDPVPRLGNSPPPEPELAALVSLASQDCKAAADQLFKIRCHSGGGGSCLATKTNKYIIN